MTVSLTAIGGTVPDFLKALTLPTITNARATTDYDGEQPAEGINHFHNYDAADNAWPFWGTRMGVSKDNFWTAYNNLTTVGWANGLPSSLPFMKVFSAFLLPFHGVCKLTSAS